jgi:hypothetical protein
MPPPGFIENLRMAKFGPSCEEINTWSVILTTLALAGVVFSLSTGTRTQ